MSHDSNDASQQVSTAQAPTASEQQASNENNGSTPGQHETNSPPAAPKYSPTDAELEALVKYVARTDVQTAPRLRIREDNTGSYLDYSHPRRDMAEVLFKQAIATTDQDFANGIITQLAGVSSSGRAPREDELNFLRATVTGGQPKDQMETLHFAQMGVIHAAMMDSAKRLQRTRNAAERESEDRTLNRLAKTFAAQMEALKRYRSGGGPSVVQHVSIADGGRAAIVGRVTPASQPSAPETLATAPLVHGQASENQPAHDEKDKPLLSAAKDGEHQ